MAQGESGPGAQSEDGEYHTPLAGEPFHTTFRGKPSIFLAGTVVTKPP
jgi:hypothetical protein